VTRVTAGITRLLRDAVTAHGCRFILWNEAGDGRDVLQALIYGDKDQKCPRLDEDETYHFLQMRDDGSWKAQHWQAAVNATSINKVLQMSRYGLMTLASMLAPQEKRQPPVFHTLLRSALTGDAVPPSIRRRLTQFQESSPALTVARSLYDRSVIMPTDPNLALAYRMGWDFAQMERVQMRSSNPNRPNKSLSASYLRRALSSPQATFTKLMGQLMTQKGGIDFEDPPEAFMPPTKSGPMREIDRDYDVWPARFTQPQKAYFLHGFRDHKTKILEDARRRKAGNTPNENTPDENTTL
jgi:hypothetical protein